MNIAVVEGLWDFTINNNSGRNYNLADYGNTSLITSRLTGAKVNSKEYNKTYPIREAFTNKAKGILC